MKTRKSFLTLTALGSVLLASGQRPVIAAEPVAGTRVQTIYTKFGEDLSSNPNWFDSFPVNHDSPDGSDIAYWPSHNTLLVCDGEVDEMGSSTWAQASHPSGFSGYNLFEMSLTGVGLNFFSTTNSTRTGWSNEPVGCDINPNNGHMFVADDDQRRVFELNPGRDEQLFTNDDSRTSFSTSAFGANDPEGVTYNPVDGALYISSGADSEVFKVMPGSNGVFDGVPPAGDDTATHFDTASQGILDPEGIAFDAANRLYVIGKPSNRLAHFYTSGALLRMVDITSVDAKKPAGLTVGSGSSDAGVRNVYISERGIDNTSDPNENDGRVYEVSVPPLPAGNQAPGVAAGPDLTVYQPSDTVTLNGAVGDEDEGSTTKNWSLVSGPGSVSFGSPDAAVTSASLSTLGSYVLRLTAQDSGGLSGSDDVTVQLREPFNGSFGTIYISTRASTTINGLFVANEDIVAYNNASGVWSMVFDGSDVGLNSPPLNVDAFKRMDDGSILLSMDIPITLSIKDPATGAVTSTLVDDSDIVRFVPTTLGPITAGHYEMYFDGSDVGLDTDNEDIDTIAFLADGRLVVSLIGSNSKGSIPGMPAVQDEDLIAFTASDMGSATVGTWQMFFDGSDVGLGNGGDREDVLGAWIENNNGVDSAIYLTTRGSFAVPGASGGSDDIFRFTPTSTGPTTAGTYTFTWDGGGNGLQAGVVVDGFDISP